MIDGSPQDLQEDERVVHELAGRPLFATEEAARRFADVVAKETDPPMEFDVDGLMAMTKGEWTEAQRAHFRRTRARREGRERKAQATATA
jgi:hypothetical protein